MLACSLANSVLVSASIGPISASVLTTAGRLNVTSSVVLTSPSLVFAFNRTVHCITPVALMVRRQPGRSARDRQASRLPQIFDALDRQMMASESGSRGVCGQLHRPTGKPRTVVTKVRPLVIGQNRNTLHLQQKKVIPRTLVTLLITLITPNSFIPKVLGDKADVIVADMHTKEGWPWARSTTC